jgi:MoaA/NifB/PqqE/SkfB family radical SAM enzyme
MFKEEISDKYPVLEKYVSLHLSPVILPIHATLELTDKCNLKCSYCYRESDFTKNLFLENPIEFLESLLKIGIRHIEFSEGEPLLHPDIIEILNFAGKKYNLVGLLTNGILINEEIIEIIKYL